MLPQIGNQEAVLAEWHEEGDRLRGRLRIVDRRLDEHLSSAAKGRISREQLHKLSVATAGDRLRLEEALEEIERKVRDQADAGERYRGRQQALVRLLDGWETLPMQEKQSLLSDLVDRVVVRDEGTRVLLRA